MTNQIYGQTVILAGWAVVIFLFLNQIQVQQWNITHHHQRRKLIFTATAHYIGVHHHCHLRQRYIAYRPQQRATNIYGNWWNSIKWTSNLQCGKWFICSYHRKNSTEILAIENVSEFYISMHRNGYLWFYLVPLETKSQFARDDPAFLVLLILCIFGELTIWNGWFLNLSQYLRLSCSYVDRIHLDSRLNIWSNRLLYCVHCYRWFHLGWHCCDNIYVAFGESVFATKRQWGWCWMGILFWCSHERILSTIGSTPFCATDLFQR